ncbi:TetR/AcrR family transcriptional regulator [Spongisporangium articulatum]|uniref:TetR/AcrR family transcriptional regulator n=1 Tax=Spongisporangium articulatum TaxID=3362603 RepID=A0ABW8AVS8_9ACTN
MTENSAVQPSAVNAKGTRLNRRGQQTRETLLRTAVRCLAEGGPDAVSANRVAREAGLTWGTVQHQFGDSDALWAAVIESIAARGWDLLPVPETAVELPDRVEAVFGLIWDAMDRAALRATHNLRMALPRSRPALEAEYPLTAAALAGWDAKWELAVRGAFEGLDVDEARLQGVRAFLPSAVRGLHEEQYLGSYVDLEVARRGLIEALTAYLR